MNFFKKLFRGNTTPEEEVQKQGDVPDFEVLKRDGLRALNERNPLEAVELLRQALQIQNDFEVRFALSKALVGCNQLAKAYEELQKLAEIQPGNINVFIRLAEVACEMKNYTAMGEACERGKLLDKDNVEINLLYARACLGVDDSVNALAMLTKTILLNENYTEAYQLRGELLLKMGDLDGAEADVEWVLNHKITLSDALLLKARIEEAQQHHASAMEFYGKVIAQNPFNVDAFRERGAIRLAQGDKQGAEEDMKQVLELSPEMQQEVSGDYSN